MTNNFFSVVFITEDEEQSLSSVKQLFTYNIGQIISHEITCELTKNDPQISFLLKSLSLRLSFFGENSDIKRCETYDIDKIKLNRMVSENNDNIFLNIKVDVRA